MVPLMGAEQSLARATPKSAAPNDLALRTAKSLRNYSVRRLSSFRKISLLSVIGTVLGPCMFFCRSKLITKVITRIISSPKHQPTPQNGAWVVT